MTATQTPGTNEFNTRIWGLRELSRAQLVLNFQAYWPGENFKGVSRDMLIVAIMQAEFHPKQPLAPSHSKATATWGSATK